MDDPLSRAGFAWFEINYRLAPKFLYPACIEDVETAIRWVKAHAAEYHLDPSRIALAGESAGGHLVDLAAARAAFFPRIGLTGSVGSAAPALSSLLGAGTGVWSFAPTLLMPLFDRGANRANLAAARVRQDIGVAQYEKAVQTAFREVADGLAARGTYGPQLDALQRYSATQQRRLELARRLYDNGIDNYLEVLTAQTDAYTARGSVVTARLNRLTSLVGLFRALGGGWEEPAAAPQKTAAIGYADRQATDNAATTL